MAKLDHTRIGPSPSRGQDIAAQNPADRSAGLRPATRRLRDVLEERGPLTGPITDAGTRALLAVRGERSSGGRDSR
jgi:hypothetical protein